MIPPMIHWSHKAHDLLAAAAGSSGIAILLSDIDVVVKLIIGVFTAMFLLLGIIGRAMELRAKAKGEKVRSEE